MFSFHTIKIVCLIVLHMPCKWIPRIYFFSNNQWLYHFKCRSDPLEWQVILLHLLQYGTSQIEAANWIYNGRGKCMQPHTFAQWRHCVFNKNKSVHFFCNKVLLQLICQVFAYSASVMYIQRYVYCQLNGHLNIFKEISIIYKAVMMVRYIPMIYIFVAHSRYML